jgi:hypothetical protein
MDANTYMEQQQQSNEALNNKKKEQQQRINQRTNLAAYKLNQEKKYLCIENTLRNLNDCERMKNFYHSLENLNTDVKSLSFNPTFDSKE